MSKLLPVGNAIDGKKKNLVLLTVRGDVMVIYNVFIRNKINFPHVR